MTPLRNDRKRAGGGPKRQSGRNVIAWVTLPLASLGPKGDEKEKDIILLIQKTKV